MAQKPSTPDNVQAVLVTACQVLTHPQRELLIELIREQQSGNPLGRLASDAAADLATACTVLLAVTAFATAMGTAGWEVID